MNFFLFQLNNLEQHQASILSSEFKLRESERERLVQEKLLEVDDLAKQLKFSLESVEKKKMELEMEQQRLEKEEKRIQDTKVGEIQ